MKQKELLIYGRVQGVGFSLLYVETNEKYRD